jgi:cell division protein FtsA
VILSVGPVFALDIGTRTVIGIVGRKEGDKFRILAQEIIEHAGRSMYDGQIHDIPQVAAAVRKVKEGLEEKIGEKLEKAAIAAAGRALATSRTSVEQVINENLEIDEGTVRNLEMVAVHKAQEMLAEGPGVNDRYYYVGHSVVSYFLDGFPISNLVGHRAKTIGADVLVTFLPASVVDSLFSVLSRVGLQPVNLTLEPIAAVDVLIPEGLRLLNLALVDIGAGTSDIAITKDGGVVAYGMVPVAGDEISEAIAQRCLVDFQTAERIKRRIKEGGEISYTDILGNEETVAAADLLGYLEPVLKRLAEEIATTILVLNGNQPPKSVFCIGGGSQVPTLPERIAEKLGIGTRRVGLKDRAALAGLIPPEDDRAAGPEGVTVVGIAASAMKNAGCAFIEVKINGQAHQVFNFPGLRVAHVLNQTDFTPQDLFARDGRDLKFFLNGREEVVRGELARPAMILVNGQGASLQTQIRHGDEISFFPARDGRDARAFVRDYLQPDLAIEIALNGKVFNLRPVCYLNDVQVEEEAEIQPEDHLVIDARYTLEKLACVCGSGLEGLEFLVNGKKVPPDYILNGGDRVEIRPAGVPGEAGGEPLAGKELPDGGGLRVQGKEEGPEKEREGIRVKVNGSTVVLTGKQSPIFLDALKYIETDLLKKPGVPVLKLNGKPAGYTDPLQDGDEIEVTFRPAPF